MTSVTVDDVITMLEHVQERPYALLKRFSIRSRCYLNGLYNALAFMGFRLQDGRFDDVYRDVVIERSWMWRSAGPWREMQQKGMNNQEIAQEVLAIEIETWKRRKAKP